LITIFEGSQMENLIAEDATARGSLLLAASLVVLFLVWRVTIRLNAANAFLSKYLWGGAIVDLILFPASTYGIGNLVVEFLDKIGLTSMERVAQHAAELLIFLSIASGFARLAEVWILLQERGGHRTKLSQIARSALYGTCLFVGILVFLTVNGYSPKELYISTGAVAALLAFAMQQTLGDLFSGIALSIEKPFRIGDWLRFSDGTEGEVIDVNWRSTHLREWDNSTFVVPNSQLARENFKNLYGSTHQFAPWYNVRVSGDADPAEIKKLLEHAALKCGAVLQEPAPIARLIDGTTIPYTYMVWVHFRNYPSMFVGREQLYSEIHYALRSAGLGVASEIQEIRLHTATQTKE